MFVMIDNSMQQSSHWIRRLLILSTPRTLARLTFFFAGDKVGCMFTGLPRKLAFARNDKGIHVKQWIPACAGMTVFKQCEDKVFNKKQIPHSGGWLVCVIAV